MAPSPSVAFEPYRRAYGTGEGLLVSPGRRCGVQSTQRGVYGSKCLEGPACKNHGLSSHNASDLLHRYPYPLTILQYDRTLHSPGEVRTKAPSCHVLRSSTSGSRQEPGQCRDVTRSRRTRVRRRVRMLSRTWKGCTCARNANPSSGTALALYRLGQDACTAAPPWWVRSSWSPVALTSTEGQPPDFSQSDTMTQNEKKVCATQDLKAKIASLLCHENAHQYIRLNSYGWGYRQAILDVLALVDTKEPHE
jgi:hypothetical protein